MKQTELNNFKKLLLQRRAQILELEKSYENEAFSHSGDTTSRVLPADMGNDETIRDIDIQLVENEIKEIQLIDESLQKIENGTYGVCMECGQNINLQRLEVLPYAHYCVRCEEEMEIVQKAQRKKPDTSSFSSPPIEEPLK